MENSGNFRQFKENELIEIRFPFPLLKKDDLVFSIKILKPFCITNRLTDFYQATQCFLTPIDKIRLSHFLVQFFEFLRNSNEIEFIDKELLSIPERSIEIVTDYEVSESEFRSFIKIKEDENRFALMF